jgi:hypothetical protein
VRKSDGFDEKLEDFASVTLKLCAGKQSDRRDAAKPLIFRHTVRFSRPSNLL